MKRIVLICLVLLAGCGGGSGTETDTNGDTRTGQELFEQRILGPNAGCITCHSLDPDTTLVGPSIAGIAGFAIGFGLLWVGVVVLFDAVSSDCGFPCL